jgi:hypothetical protein
MSEGDGADPPPGGDDLQGLARDWIALWQSELAALAVDREGHEAWQTLLAMWAGQATAVFATIPRSSADDAARDRRTAPGDGARPPASPRPAATAPAPDARDVEIERLRERVAELERRLAALERRRP